MEDAIGVKRAPRPHQGAYNLFYFVLFHGTAVEYRVEGSLDSGAHICQICKP